MKVNVISCNDTNFYNIRKEDNVFIKEIRTVYAYNPESCTNLCELTPSYELRYLYTYIVFTCDPSEDKHSELEERYCQEDNEDTYMHCSSVRAMNPKECGEFDDMEAACEYLKANWPI